MRSDNNLCDAARKCLCGEVSNGMDQSHSKKRFNIVSGVADILFWCQHAKLPAVLMLTVDMWSFKTEESVGVNNSVI